MLLKSESQSISGQSSRTVCSDYDAIGNSTSAIIASPATTATLTRRLTWGQDLAGSPSLQGAGGVGGLLMVEEITSTTNEAYHFHYDGNGNVTEITDHLGASVATYRYDAFGNTLVATGTYAATNRYRFSTKPLDHEVTTAPLYYYGYRYLDPVTGRWPSRDPIEEVGGVNLYGFVYNCSTCFVDRLGLDPVPTVQERATPEERRQAAREAGVPNRGGTKEDFEEALKKIVEARERKEGKVVVHNKKVSCDCGVPSLRVSHTFSGGGKGFWSGPRRDNVNPWQKLVEGEAVELDRNRATYDIRVDGNKCDKVTVRVSQSYQAEDFDWLEKNPGAAQPQLNPSVSFEWNGKPHAVGPPGGGADHKSPFAQGRYEDPQNSINPVQKLTWVRIELFGYMGEELCCEKVFWVK